MAGVVIVHTLYIPIRSSFLIFFKTFTSLRTVMIPSMEANWLSRSRRSSMTKKRKAQNGAPGMCSRASVNTMNARPGPVETCVYVCVCVCVCVRERERERVRTCICKAN